MTLAAVLPGQTTRDLVQIRPDLASRASVDSVRQMLLDIVAVRGRDGAKAVLGIPGLTFRRWCLGHRVPSAAARRLILIVWLLVVKRYPINEFDIVTDGRFILACGNDTPSSGSNSDCGALENSTNT